MLLHLWPLHYGNKSPRISQYFFFFKGSGPHRALHSSPTGRFPDLPVGTWTKGEGQTSTPPADRQESLRDCAKALAAARLIQRNTRIRRTPAGMPLHPEL